MTPKRPTLPEGTDPVAALRQLQQQLAEARYTPLGRGGYWDDQRARDEGARDAERTAGMNLAPIVDAVEALVDSLREQLRDVDPFDGPGATAPAWYGSVWMCPVDDCEWAHREENAVSSTDPVAAERVRTALVGHLGDHGSQQPHEGIVNALAARVFDWPAHCSEWIAGSDPENPEPCPEYASPGSDKCALHDYAGTTLEAQGWLSPSQAAELRATAHRLTVEAFARPHRDLTEAQRREVTHGGHPDAKPHPRVAYPPLNTKWRHGFPPRGTSTMWRCQRCGTNHEGNPPRCLHCGHTVLDPGHWVALPGGTG